jgi:glutamate-1-semialdehyde 2,1-aminomutase
VIVEGIIHGLAIHPNPGFLKGLADLCHSCGIPLVLDEIITGFRHDLGGLQRKWGIDADIAVYGKAMANGYVISAVTGKKKYMETLSPGTALLSGTFNGNPLSCAASLKTIEILGRPGFYERLFQLGDTLREGINREAQRLGVNALCYGYGSVWGLLFDRHQPENYRDVLNYLDAGGSQKFAAFTTHMLNHGIFLPPFKKRALRHYIYGAHSENDIQKTIDAAAAFLNEHRADLK